MGDADDMAAAMVQILPGYNRWEVNVLYGASDVPADGPVRFGTTELVLSGSEDKPASIQEPLVYSPVGLRSYDNVLQLVTFRFDQGRIGWEIHREMDHVFRVEFQEHGSIRVEGLETREDGATVRSAWEVDLATLDSGEDEPE